jgi:hypothetical protein
VEKADRFERKERKKERKGSLSKTDNEEEVEFTLNDVDNPAFGVMGTVFTQSFTKVYHVCSHPLEIHVEG